MSVGSVVFTLCFSLFTHLQQTDLLHVPAEHYPYFENLTRKNTNTTRKNNLPSYKYFIKNQFTVIGPLGLRVSEM